MFDFKSILSVTLVLFSVIDIVGSIPIIIDLRKKTGHISSLKATLAAGVIMVSFLYVGKVILNLLGVDIHSFALAGALIIFFLGLEMVLDQHIFRSTDEQAVSSTSVFPIAFPLIAGAGTMTTIISLRAQYEVTDILVGIVLNLIIVFVVLKSSSWIERKLGASGTTILRKVFGVVLLSIAIKIFKSNWGL